MESIVMRTLVPISTGAVLALSCFANADVIQIAPSKDNTLFFDAAGSVSNGAGSGFFAGANSAGSVRRGVLAFDIAAAIPAGSVITAATLTLHNGGAQATNVPIELHRLLANWGEGTSNSGASGGSGAPSTPGDATWIHTFYPSSFWATPGGDFAAASSASQSVGGAGSYSWSSATMAADIQSWLASPAANFGWIVMGGESILSSAKRFDSRESTTVSFRPVLEVTYTVPSPGVASCLVAGLILARRRRNR